MSNPVRKINEDVRSFVERSNFNQRGLRVVPLGTALEVARRSLASTEGETFSVRRFRALSDVSDYISLTQKNKWNSAEPRNTDLLPVAHPASTRKHRMSDLQVRKSRARWFADDSRVTDSRVGPLLATAFTFAPGTAEHQYAVARLTAMGGQVPAAALVAAVTLGFNDGANRGFWRQQLRDRFGRFAEMGGGLRALIRRGDGNLYRMNGSVVSTNVEDDEFVIERPDGELVNIPAQAGESVKAFIPEESTSDGFSREPVSAGSDEPVIDEADLQFVEAPNGFSKTEGRVDLEDDEAAPEVWLDDLENYEVAKVRDGEFIVSRNGDDEVEPFAVVDSWAEVQRVIEKDEPLFERGESPELEGDLAEAGIAELPTEEEAVDADIAEIERDQQNLPDEDIAAGFGFDPEPGVENEWDGGFDENDNRIIVQKINDDNWNIALVVDDGDVRDVAQADSAYEAFDQANVMRDRPQDFDAGRVAEKREERAEEAEEAYRVDRGEYEPAGPDGEVESEDYTDDPADLATRFEPEELAESLKESVEDGSGIARLEFEEGDEDVPAEALYNSLKEQGADVDGFLDDIEAGRDSEISLPDAEPVAELPERRVGRNEDAVALRELLGDDMPALFQGLSDRELQEVIDKDYDYRDYVSAPENIDAPEGFYKLEEDAVDPTVDVPGAPEGMQPFQFAVEYSPEELEEKFREAMKLFEEPRRLVNRLGYAQFEVDGADGEREAFDVPAEVIFDGLELNGVDANALVREIYDGGEPTPEQLDEIAEGEGLPEAPSPEDIDNAEEVFGGLSQEEKDALIQSTKEGGYTVDFVSGDVPEDGYMVAAEADIPRGAEGFRKREEIISFADFEADPEKYLDAFVRRNVDKLEQDDYYIGTWVDTDEDGNQWVYLDVSERFTDKEEALQAAEERGEIAAFGIAEFEEFFVDPEREAQKNAGEQEAEPEEGGERSEELPGDVGDGTPGVDGEDGPDVAGEPEEGLEEEPVEAAEQPEMPPALPGSPEPASSGRDVILDTDGDLVGQIENAINNGDVVVFRYNDKIRRFAPQSIWENPKNGNINAYGRDLTDGGATKNFTISKIEKADANEVPEAEGREVTPAPEPAEPVNAREFVPSAPEAADMDEQEVRRLVAEREELLLRSQGRDRYNLPPIPDKYRRQVYIRLLAGLYADENGNPLAIGDKVVHRNPNKRDKYGEGEVIDKKQGKVGGLQRAGVVYVDYAWVKFPGFEPVPLVSRFLRHTDDDVAAQRFAEEPRINWMNAEQMREALSERAKKPRKEQPAAEREAEPEIQKAVTDIKSVVAEDVPEPEEQGGEVEQPDFEWNTQWMDENVPAMPRAAEELTKGDFVALPQRGPDEERKIYRVVSVTDQSVFAQAVPRKFFVLEDEDGRQKTTREVGKTVFPETYRLADKAASDASNRPPRAGDIVGSDFEDGGDGSAILRGLKNIQENYLPNPRNTRAPQYVRNAAKDMDLVVRRVEQAVEEGNESLDGVASPSSIKRLAQEIRKLNLPDNKYNIARQAIPDLERLAAVREDFIESRELEAVEALNAKHAEGLPTDLFEGADASSDGMKKLFDDLGRFEEFLPDIGLDIDDEFAYDMRQVRSNFAERMASLYGEEGTEVSEEARLKGANTVVSELLTHGQRLRGLYTNRENPRLEFYKSMGERLFEQGKRLEADIQERAESLQREYDERINTRLPESEMPTAENMDYEGVQNFVDAIRAKLPESDRYAQYNRPANVIINVPWRQRTAAYSLDKFDEELKNNQNDFLQTNLDDLDDAIRVLADDETGQAVRTDLIEFRSSILAARRNTPVRSFAGPGLEEVDPVEIQEQRISDGENAFEANSSVGRVFSAEAENAESPLNAYADEIQEFFRADSGSKPLAQLSPRARVALQSSASQKLKNPVGDGEDGLSREDYDNIFQLMRQLEDEDKVYLPKREGVGGNAEVLRNFADTSRLFEFAEDEEILDENDNPTGWFVTNENGGGINSTRQLVFRATGERLWVKKERFEDTARAEYASARLANILGFPGAPTVEFANDFENNKRTLFVTQAGQDMRLVGDVRMAGESGLSLSEFRAVDADTVNKLSLLDTVRMGVLDILIDNADRHGGNYLIGQADSLGLSIDFESKRIIPIDHGYAQVFGSGGADTPVQRYITTGGRSGGSLNRKLLQTVGAENYAAMVRPILDDFENELGNRERYLGLYGEDFSTGMDELRERIAEFKGIVDSEQGLTFLRQVQEEV